LKKPSRSIDSKEYADKGSAPTARLAGLKKPSRSIDGKEYADKRSAATARLAGLKKPSPSSKTKVNPSRERRMSAVIRRGIMRFIRSLPLAALAVCEIKLAVNVDGRQGLPTAT